MWNLAASTGALVAKAVPCAFRHMEQWQHTIGPSSPSSWYLTAPQRQLPSSMIDDPTGIRTPVTALKGPCPRPLDDGVETAGKVAAGRAGVKGSVRRSAPPSEPPPAQLTEQPLVERRRVEVARPADLRPVVGLDLRQDLAPGLGEAGDEAVVLSGGGAQVQPSGEEERVGAPAGARDADDRAVGDPRDVRHGGVEVAGPGGREIVQAVERDSEPTEGVAEPAADEAGPEIRQRRPAVRRRHRGERGDAVGQT